jgi:hypothetical protein
MRTLRAIKQPVRAMTSALAEEAAMGDHKSERRGSHNRDGVDPATAMSVDLKAKVLAVLDQEEYRVFAIRSRHG